MNLIDLHPLATRRADALSRGQRARIAFDALALGEKSVGGLGVAGGRTRVLTPVACGLLAVATVAVPGPISLVGLIVPHVVRPIAPTAIAPRLILLRHPGSPLTNKQTGFLTITATDSRGNSLTERFRQRGGCCRICTVPARCPRRRGRVIRPPCGLTAGAGRTGLSRPAATPPR